MAADGLIEMVVESVRVHMLSNRHVVILKEKERERYLPIWIGPWEASSIAMRLQGLTPERPLSAPPVLDAIPVPRPAYSLASPAVSPPSAASSNAGGLPLGGSPAPVIYSQADRYVVGPVEVSRKMPTWRPPPTVKRGVYHGLIEIIIDERGMVEKVMQLISVEATYDPLLLEAARAWRFRPATLNGEAVKYRRQYEIILHPE